MNAQPNTTQPNLDRTLLEPSSPGPEQDSGNGNVSPPVAGHYHRGNGKIAQLPKPLRDRINAMLDDGVSYRLILQKLKECTEPPLPYPLSVMNISRWKDNGYQHYLAHKERLAAVRANREAALDMVASDDTTTLPEAALQIIASQYFDVLGDFSPAALKQKLLEDPLKYTRFLNVFARLAREILNLKKHREAAAKAAVAELKKLDPEREFSDREHEIITDRMDDYFLKPRRRRPNADQRDTPPNPSNPATTHH